MLSTAASPLAIALLALIQAPALGVQESETEDGFCLTSRAFGTTCTSCATCDAILKSPAWDQETESPSVSPRKAIRLAEKTRKSVVKAPDGSKWNVADLRLRFVGDHCAWQVTFRASQLEAGLVDSHEVAIFVLMDGAVLKPKAAGE